MMRGLPLWSSVPSSAPSAAAVGKVLPPADARTRELDLTLPALLLRLAVVFQIALLPLLWNEASSVPSAVWTSIGLVLMLAAMPFAPGLAQADAKVVLGSFAFLALFQVFCVISALLNGVASPERYALLWAQAPVMFLAAVTVCFGAALRSSQAFSSLALAWVVVVGYALLSRESFMVEEIYSRFQQMGVKTEYQYLGDVFAIASLLLIVRLRSDWAKIAVMLLSVAAMFTIPSRSAAFFGALMALLAVALTVTPRGRWSLAGVIVAAAAAFLIYSGGDVFAGTRFESLIAGTEDTSVMLREEFKREGEEVIAHYPLLGNWAFQYQVFGESGWYVHSALDVWAQAGLIPFAAFIALWGMIATLWWRLWREDPAAAFESLPALLFSAVTWAFSRNLSSVVQFLAVGYFAAAAGASMAWRGDAGEEASGDGQ